MNSGLRLDWLGISIDGGVLEYKAVIDACRELMPSPGLPMYPLGFETDGYRLYLQDGESLRELIAKKEGNLVDRNMLNLSNAYPLGLIVFDHMVLWAGEFGYIQDVIAGYEDLGCRHHVTRVDLNTLIDFDMNYFSSGEYKKHVSCRAVKGATEFGASGYETIYFGDKRSRKRVLARIYNKRIEVEKSKKVYVVSDKEDWNNITTVEFELHRDGLRRWGVDTIDDLFGNIYRLWKRCTDWLKFVDESGSYEDWWEEVKSVELVNGIKVKRTYEERGVDIERLYRIIKGYIDTAVSVDVRARGVLMGMIENANVDKVSRRVVYRNVGEGEAIDREAECSGLESGEDIPF